MYCTICLIKCQVEKQNLHCAHIFVNILRILKISTFFNLNYYERILNWAQNKKKNVEFNYICSKSNTRIHQYGKNKLSHTLPSKVKYKGEYMMDTNSLGGGTRESCCRIKSILRGRDVFPFLFLPSTGSGTEKTNEKRDSMYRTFIQLATCP